jgi:hypothetical protein
MPTICYTAKTFNDEHARIIEQANRIIRSYAQQGYDLTLRQLYYQFVSRDWFPASWASAETGSTNNERSYKKLGSIISDARRAGLIDWDAIVDRTRNVRIPPMWADPSHIVRACAGQFSVDWWADQGYRPEVWVEKDALLGVIEVACEPWHCPYFSCRGYTSDSEVWSAARRLAGHLDNGQTPIVFHLGDHDPSGIDMSRDIFDRVRLFADAACEIEVKRIALTMGQVEEVGPPPNPAKTTDSRYKGYQEEYGKESWELDALNPEYLTALIAAEMSNIVDNDAWAESNRRQNEGRRLLGEVSKQWPTLTEGL